MQNGGASTLSTGGGGAPISSSEGVDTKCNDAVLLPSTSQLTTTDTRNECAFTRDAAGASSFVVQSTNMQPSSVDIASLPVIANTLGGSMQSHGDIILPPAITTEPRLGVGMPHSCTTPIGSTAASAVTPEDLALQLESLGPGELFLHRRPSTELIVQFID